MAGDRELCLQAGMNDYLAKPITKDALSDALQRNLPSQLNQCSQSSQSKNDASKQST